MDRPLLERMVGAVVLVAVLIIVAPGLLDGTGDRPDPAQGSPLSRTEVIYLQTPQPEDRPAAALPAGTGVSTGSGPAEPAQSAATAQPVQPVREIAREPASQAAATAPSPAREAAPAPAQASVQGSPRTGFAVQVGSFSSADRAEQFAAGVKERGYRVFVAGSGAGQDRLFRVYSGPEESREAAERLAQGLRGAGYSVMIVDLAGR